VPATTQSQGSHPSAERLKYPAWQTLQRRPVTNDLQLHWPPTYRHTQTDCNSVLIMTGINSEDTASTLSIYRPVWHLCRLMNRQVSLFSCSEVLIVSKYSLDVVRAKKQPFMLYVTVSMISARSSGTSGRVQVQLINSSLHCLHTLVYCIGALCLRAQHYWNDVHSRHHRGWSTLSEWLTDWLIDWLVN